MPEYLRLNPGGLVPALIDSVPGVGEHTISVALSYASFIVRMDNAKQFAAFGGLNPALRESGTIRAKPTLSKTGHVALRRAPSLSGMVTLNRAVWGRRFKTPLQVNHKAPKLIIGAMVRKLAHAIFGVLKFGKLFDPALHGC